jgi:hypothetical protein
MLLYRLYVVYQQNNHCGLRSDPERAANGGFVVYGAILLYIMVKESLETDTMQGN